MSKIQATASHRYLRHGIETNQCPSFMPVLFDKYQTTFETWEISHHRCDFLYFMVVAEHSICLPHLLKGVVSPVLQSLVNFEELSYWCRVPESVRVSWSPSLLSIVLYVITLLRKYGKYSLSSETILDHAGFCIRMSL